MDTGRAEILTKQTTGHAMTAYQAVYGLNLLAYGNELLSKPCATKPLWNRRYVTQMPNQVIKPAIEVMLTNHWKTFDDPLFTLMKARNEKAAQKHTA